MSNAHNPCEKIAIVNKNDNIIAIEPRGNHANGKLHRESSVLIINLNNKILIQKRANSERLDYSASGHFSFFETYLEGALREVEEELGLNIPKSKFIKIKKFRINYSGEYINNRFITLYEVKGEYRIKDMKIDHSEVKSVKYYSISKLKKLIKFKPEIFSQGFIESIRIYFNKKGI
ncbi:MAG: NUDIX domain-containing protein [Promethearchaeota archaeon]